MRGKTGKRSFISARRALRPAWGFAARRAASLAFALALTSGFAHGANAKPDLDLLDRYLDRADEARNETEWAACSESGEEAILARWESAMLSLADAGVDYAALKTEAASAIKDKVERRLSAWLMDRFFSSAGEADLAGLLNGMKRSTLAAIFELDGNGSVRLDAEGDPIQREFSDAAAFETELGAWKASARGLEDQAIADWETRSTEAFAELLSGLSPGARANLEASGTARLADYGASLRREADAMLALEESNYRYLGLKDQYSLRLESEGEGAESVVDGLVGKAQAALEVGLKNLKDGLDAEVGAVSIDGNPIDGDEWQERFRDELDKGLALWEKAGEDFIARRVEWEQRAGNDLASGIDEWNAALRDLLEREGAWLDEFQTVRERAEAQYDRRFAEIDQAQKQARAELDASVAANEGNLAERIEVTVDALDQSLEMMKTARESVGYWISRTDGNADFSIDAVPWDANALRCAALRPLFTAAAKSLGNESLSEIAPEERTYTNMLLRAVVGQVSAAIGAGELIPSEGEIALMVADGVTDGTLRDSAGYLAIARGYYQELIRKKAGEAFSSILKEKLTAVFGDGGSAVADDGLSAMLRGSSGSSSLGSALSGPDQSRLRAIVETLIVNHVGTLIDGGFGAHDLGPDSLSAIYEQACYWVETVYANYATEAERQNEDLTASYGLVVFEGKDIPTDGYSSGQTITGPIEALNAYGWESIYLDSYQVELLKARAVDAYWKKELEVAQAVYDYSVNDSSTRDTEAETLTKAAAALEGYTAALQAYNSAVDDLKAIDTALTDKNAAIRAIQADLGKKKEALAAAKENYARLLALSATNNLEYYTGEFRSYFEAIAKLRGESRAGDSILSPATELASSAIAYDSEFFVKSTSEALAALIHGTSKEDERLTGMAELKARYDARAGFHADPAQFGNESFLEDLAKSLAITVDDPWYAVIAEAYRGYGGAFGDAGARKEFACLLNGAARALEGDSRGALERRMMDIRLLLSGTDAAAYASIGDLALGAPGATSVDDAVALLKDSALNADRDLLAVRLGTEIAAFTKLLDDIDAYARDHADSVDGFSEGIPSEAADSSATLAWLLYRALSVERQVPVDGLRAYVAGCKGSLLALQTIVTVPIGSEEERNLRSLSSTDRLAMIYLNGGTLFAMKGVDCVIPYIADEYAMKAALSGAAAEYASYAAFSPGLQSVTKGGAIDAFSQWIARGGLGSVNGKSLTLKAPEELWKSFNPVDAKDAVGKIVDLTSEAKAALSSAGTPSYFQEAVEAWLSEVSTLFMTRSMFLFGDGTVGDDGALRESAKSAANESIQFAALFGEFGNRQASPEKRAIAALRLMRGDVEFPAAVKTAAVATLAGSLCANRLGLPEGRFESWDAQYAPWFAALGADDPDGACRDGARAAIIARARELWENAQFRVNQTYDEGTSANSSMDLERFAEPGNDAQIPLAYTLGDAAYARALKERVLSGYDVSSYLETASVAVRDDLSRFIKIVGAVSRYIPSFDGDFPSYLATLDEPLAEEEKIAATSLATLGWFDDPFYDVEIGEGGVKAYIGAVNARDESTLSLLAAYLSEPLSEECARLQRVQSLAETRTIVAEAYDERTKAHDGAWRAYIGNPALIFDGDGDGKIDGTSLSAVPYTAPSPVPELVSENDGVLRYSANARVNDGLESAARARILSGALGDLFAAWAGDDLASAASDYLAANKGLSFVDPVAESLPDAFSSFGTRGVSASAITAYQDASRRFYGLSAQQSELAKSLAGLGETVTDYIANKDNSLVAMTASARERISAIQNDLDAVELAWKVALDDPPSSSTVASGNYASAGYRQLEAAYAARYSDSQSAFERLDAAKQARKISKAVYDYASSPYLRVTGGLFAEGDDETLASLQSVDPDTRLAAVRDHARRSDAAIAALESLYGSGEQKKSLYERDGAYKALKDSYETAYRNRIATLQAKAVLNAEIAKAESEYEDAKDRYEKAVAGMVTPDLVYEDARANAKSEKPVSEWLADIRASLTTDAERRLLDGVRIVDGKLSFAATTAEASAGQDAAVVDAIAPVEESALAAYFSRYKDRDLSAFETDLARWLESSAGQDFDVWSKALSWEEFELAGGQTWERYRAEHPPRLIVNEQYHSSNMQSEQNVYDEYHYFIHDKITRTLLANYDGATSGEQLKRAINHEITDGSLEEILQGMEDAYEAVKGDANYGFYKMLNLTGAFAFDTESGTKATSKILLNGCFAYEFYEEARIDAHHHGKTHYLSRMKWYNAADEAIKKRNCAILNYCNKINDITAAQKKVIDLKDAVYQKKTALTALKGVDPVTGVVNASFDGLIDAIVLAAGHLPQSINDILLTGGVVNPSGLSSNGKRAALRKILSSNGSIETDFGATDYDACLSALSKEHADRVGEVDGALGAYLHATGAKEGLAVTQERREKAYEEAYAKYVADGILPDAAVNAQRVTAWEAILKRNFADPKAKNQAIAAAVNAYLTALDGAGTAGAEDKAIGDLRIAWVEYRKSQATGVAQETSCDLLRERFAAVATGYRHGIDFLSAYAAAFERRGETANSSHVYDAREDIIRTYELYRELLSDFEKEQSDLKGVCRKEISESLKASILTMNENRLEAYEDVRANEWSILKDELSQERADYQAQMDAILSRGKNEWKKGANALQTAQKTWMETFQANFEKKTGLWDDRYLAFIEAKESWAKDLTAQAVNLGDKTILGRVPELTADYVNEAGGFIIADVIERPDPKRLIKEILDENLLSGLLCGGKTLSVGITGFSPVIFQRLRRDTFTGADILDRVREYQTRRDDELQARLAYVQYDKAMETLKKARGEVEEILNESNASTWKGFRDMFLCDGFTVNGDNFTKRTVVGATLLDNLYETHAIRGFQYFKTEVRDFTKDFALPDGIQPEIIGTEGIRAILAKAMESVPKEYDRIYGKRVKDHGWENATYERQYMGQESYQAYVTVIDPDTHTAMRIPVPKTRNAAVSEGSSAEAYEQYLKNAGSVGDSERVVVHGNGTFNEWVGYAPVMKSDADPGYDIEDYQRNVKFAGSGETGRIMGMFIQHKMIEGSGMAAGEQPAYNRKIWDDRGSWMEAPTIRSVIDVAVAIVASIYCGPVGAMLVNMIDDAVFSIMDIGNGMDAFAAAEGFAKKAAVSAVTSRVGAGFSNAGGLLSSNMLGSGVVGTSVTRGLEIAATNTAGSAINAFSVRSLMEGKDCFDENAFGKGAFGKGAVASVAAGMAGNAVSGAYANAIDHASFVGFSGKYLGGVNNLGSTVGVFASTAVTYGMTGNASVNLLNASMGGLKNLKNGNPVNVGLFELSFGNNGMHGAISSNGPDLNLGKLASSLNGITALNENRRIAEEGKARDGKDTSAMQRALLSYGDEKGRELYEAMLSKKAVVEYGNTGSDGEGGVKLAETVKDENGTYHIKLARYSDDPYAQILEAVIMEHESYRDGVESVDQAGETENAVRAHAEMAKRIRDDGVYQGLIENSAFLNNEIDNLSLEGAEFSRYVADSYDSSGDYWRVTKEGNIIFDGSKNLYDANGKLIKEYTGTGGYTTSLASVLGVSEETAKSMLKGANLTYRDGTFKTSDGVDAKNNANIQIKMPDQVRKQYTNPVQQFYASVIRNLTNTADAIGDLSKEIKNDVYDLDKMGKKWLSQHFGSSTNKTNQETSADVNDFIERTQKLKANGVAYASDRTEETITNGIVSGDSKKMDCMGLISYLFQTRKDWTVADFSNNKDFYEVQERMPGDVMCYIASKGSNSNNHGVVFLGAYGPGKSDEQIIESADGFGPRFSTVAQVNDYYKSNKYNYIVKTYRHKKD